MRVLRLFFALRVLVALLILNKNISKFLIRSVVREQKWKGAENLNVFGSKISTINYFCLLCIFKIKYVLDIC